MNERAKSIFKTAKCYSKAANIINQAANSDPSLLIPRTINAALALEMYFKSLYYIEKGEDFKENGRHSHNYFKLFMRLTEELRTSMIKEFERILENRNMNDVKIIESQTKMTMS